jgi:hypothetical protein
VSAGAKLREENGGIDPLCLCKGSLVLSSTLQVAACTLGTPHESLADLLLLLYMFASHATFFLSHFSASISITTHKTF